MFCTCNLLGIYNKEWFSRLVFYKLSDLQRLERRSELLLDEMLPYHVLQEIRDKNSSGLRRVREYHDMTCLFADISGFTAYSKSVSAHEVVNLVTRLFSYIDQRSREQGVYKVCTIGDCYVATVEPDSKDVSEAARMQNRQEGCERMFEFARYLIDEVQYSMFYFFTPCLSVTVVEY